MAAVKAIRASTTAFASEASYSGRAKPAPISGVDRQPVCQDGSKRGRRGFDGGKIVKGRKRHILVDVLGHLIAADVHSAGDSDKEGAKPLLRKICQEQHKDLVSIMADGAYSGPLQNWFFLKSNGTKTLQIVKRSELPGFQVQPKRWVVERSFAWLLWLRRLSKDYEHHPETSRCRLFIADSFLIARKLNST